MSHYPATNWFNLPIARRSVAKVLRINPDDAASIYALIPFRVARCEDTNAPLISAAWPAPYIEDTDYSRIEQVLHWNPRTGALKIDGDPKAALFGKWHPTASTGALYGDPLAFFQDWARARVLTRRTQKEAWLNNLRGPETDALPGVLALTDVGKVRWPAQSMPASIDCVGIDPAALNRAIMRSIRIPQARVASRLKAVA